MMVFANDIRAVMWVAVVPAFIAVALLMIYVREPESGHSHADGAVRRRLPLPMPGAWVGLLVHRAARRGLHAGALQRRFSGAARAGCRARPRLRPAGDDRDEHLLCGSRLPGRRRRRPHEPAHLLFLGLALLIAADLVLALAASPLMAFAGAALWGLHMAFTQGLLSKLVADTAPAELRGTAFGIFNLLSGGALLLASVIAGALWSAFGASATFLAGAAFAALAAIGLIVHRPQAAA